jgi:deazaflavin-dependent oxidoreductase (nitroreductase family)
MTPNQQAGSRRGRRSGPPGAVSRWVQQRLNAPMHRNLRGGRGRFLGMDVLLLPTVGRRSSQPRQSPVAWFADGQDAWQIVASGGRRHPDWSRNLMAHPERGSMELPGRDAVPVTPHRLEGAERQQPWQPITAAQPRDAKYQHNTDRESPVVRLTPR